MGDIVVTLEGEFAQEEGLGWEGRVFRRVCAAGQRVAAYLEALDQALFEQRPGDWAVVGFRERTVVTRFGEVCIRRRLYGSEMSFRTAAGLLVRWQAGLLSSSTCWRLLQCAGEATARAEVAAVQAMLERGERVPKAREREVERLFMEADLEQQLRKRSR